MRYGNRSPWKRIISSPITLVVMLVVFGFTSKAAWNVYQKSSGSAERLAEAQASLGGLEDRIQDLSKKVAYLATDQGVRSEIRTKFRAVEEGESVAVIIDERRSANTVGASSTPRVSWWKGMLRMIGL